MTVEAEVNRDIVEDRLARIKSITRAAGVDDLSMLGTLTVTRRTRMRPGNVLKASAAANRPHVDWTGVVTDFSSTVVGDRAAALRILDGHLLSRYSPTGDVANRMRSNPSALNPRLFTMPDRVGRAP